MSSGRTQLAVLVGLVGSMMSANAQTPAPARDLPAMLDGLAQRVQQYFERISSIICDETVTTQELKSNLAPAGKPRVTVYELSVSRLADRKGDGQFAVARTLQAVNGKPARKNQEPYCTDPKTGTPEPLSFLLTKNQGRFKFFFPTVAAAGPAGAVALDFLQLPPDRFEVRWHGDCFEAEGGGTQGRIWVDPQSFDVLQVDSRMTRPFMVPLPRALGPTPGVRVERSETTIRFARVKFEQPEETVLLPETAEVLTVFRGVPSLRTVQRLSNFRRFLAEGKVRPAGL